MRSTTLQALFTIIIYTAFAPSAAAKTYSAFSDLRYEMLNAIGKANKTVYLATAYLTDGEIVTALYLAKYRKIDVKVFLGFQKANHYMSRLSYLKRQKIPTFLAPRTFPLKGNTIIQIDQRVFTSDSDLDYKSLKRSFSFNILKKAQSESYIKAFASSLKSPMPARFRPRISAGRSNLKPSRIIYKPKAQNGIYNYDRHSQPNKAPAGIPTKLPKKTRQQLKEINPAEEAINKSP